ncbi:MAG TPA: RNA polymerase factor sigma-54, partial [Salinisphaeraceae bacterium]|nr:RNA polymerase factor sigma-54 [Salinisphaeraceae bacterium]
MKQSLQLGLTQRLTMTPALQQAIRMLQLSTLDLKAEIQQALESNFMLEAVDSDTTIAAAPGQTPTEGANTTAASEDIPDNLAVDADWSDIYSHDGPPAMAARNPVDEQAWHEFQQANLSAAPDLHAHLAWQADMQPFSVQERAAASHLIDAINDNGLLENWTELCPQLASLYELAPTDAERVLATIQKFDPAGVGARNLAECLAIQLRQLDQDVAARDLALTIVENGHLETLATAGIDGLTRNLEASRDQLAAAHALLQTLQPHPGDSYHQPQFDYVIPEIEVMHGPAGWQVVLNPDIAPTLRINAHYQQLVKSGSREERDAVKARLQEARFFLNSLRSRNDTLLQVAQYIVAAQRGFLEYGPEGMQPMVLRDVANHLDLHESTVSRATANKFM